MDYELKNYVTALLQKARAIETNDKVSEYVVLELEKSHPGAWICAIGKKFAVNIMHEPGYFIRVSTLDFHYVIFKVKEYDK